MAYATRSQVDRWFVYPGPTPEKSQKIRGLRDRFHGLAVAVLEEVPRGADQSAVFRKLREALLTASAAIAIDRGVHEPAGDPSTE